MRLLTRSNLISTLVLLMALVISGLYIYDQVSEEVRDEIDEELQNRKLEILASLPASGYPENSTLKADFRINPISPSEYKKLKEHYEDIEVYELVETEIEPHRQLVTKFEHQGKYYQLQIETSLLDLEDMGEVITRSTAWVCLGLVLLAFIVNLLLQKRLWRSFYQTLEQLKNFRVDHQDHLLLPQSSIYEFQELTQTVSTLAEVNRKSYQQQKQFVENASHEIQTPLAIALNQTEQLIQNPDLKEEDALTIGLLTEQLERLSALNKALLLITKINNQQFGEQESVEVNPMVIRLINEYEFLAEDKQLDIQVTDEESIIVQANEYLIEILVRNLIRNAYLHTPESGFIKVQLSPNKLEIRNSARAIAGKTEDLFNRFTKQSTHRQSLGLGLSIVKSICDAYGYQPKISSDHEEFMISIQF
ncbi:HAMP domain-containing sensor histidine kinase [Siphonobacter sp. SORGH_AS_1065]|uniref:sensor histidine kinase n=1 Tax=Siphonobacter sp. SORGH_AS_1065 TaxID=3041795 RepID=UPI0027878E0A|nr:HAMP domain-containing sensor histidine kinase [Siphonobacter sp. SORGH_AS_1065]MDQ1086057.1 signal transduction histidine kinase [Siphonobacter sp. SORGH_AS_1065]